MFTGIIEGIGVIASVQRNVEDIAIDVDTHSLIDNPVIGESIALNGVCLTVVKINGPILTFDLSAETIKRTTFANVKYGARMNLERAMRLGDRMGGHYVQGHVDCVGTITRITPSGEGYLVEIKLPTEGMRYVIEKGSIAISGISLTVADKLESSITIAVIPHTWDVTSLKELSSGSTVNVEYDIIAKYVENMVLPFNKPGNGNIDEDFLNRHGF